MTTSGNFETTQGLQYVPTIYKLKKSQQSPYLPIYHDPDQECLQGVSLQSEFLGPCSPLPVSEDYEGIASLEIQLDVNDYLTELIKDCEKMMILNRNKDVGMSAFTSVILNSLGRLGSNEVVKIQNEILQKKKNSSFASFHGGTSKYPVHTMFSFV